LSELTEHPEDVGLVPCSATRPALILKMWILSDRGRDRWLAGP
jgi:hypothetical protein